MCIAGDYVKCINGDYVEQWVKKHLTPLESCDKDNNSSVDTEVNSDTPVDSAIVGPVNKSVCVGDYVAVKLTTNGRNITTFLYVGKILKTVSDDVLVEFMERRGTMYIETQMTQVTYRLLILLLNWDSHFFIISIVLALNSTFNLTELSHKAKLYAWITAWI